MRALALAALLAACSTDPHAPPPCSSGPLDAPLVDPCCDLPDAQARTCFASHTIGCHVFTCSVCPLRQIDTCESR